MRTGDVRPVNRGQELRRATGEERESFGQVGSRGMPGGASPSVAERAHAVS
jgi:hypothetical protein